MIKVVLSLSTLSVVCLSVVAQQTVNVPVAMTGVTVYRDQAELNYSGRAIVKAGPNELVIRGIPLGVDRSSVRIQLNGQGLLMGFDLKPEKADTQALHGRLESFRDSLRRARLEIDRNEGRRRVNQHEERIYLGNTNLNAQTAQLAETVRALATTYRARLEALETERQGIDAALALHRAEAIRIEKLIDESMTEALRPRLQLVISFAAEGPGPILLSFSYLAPGGSWRPEYVLQVNGSGAATLTLMAQVTNTTGIVWKDQRLNFSTAQPNRSSTPPAVMPRFLPWYPQPSATASRSPSLPSMYKEVGSIDDATTVVGRITSLQGQAMIGATVSLVSATTRATIGGVYADQNGEFSIRLPHGASGSHFLRISYVGVETVDISPLVWGRRYAVAMAESSSPLSEQVIVDTRRGAQRDRSENSDLDNARDSREVIYLQDAELYQVYRLDQAVTIDGEGGSQTLSLISHPLQLTLSHQARPADDRDAFLIAEARGWQSLQLLSGPMRVTYDGTFVGQSAINARQMKDTVEIGLGRDTRVLVTRELNRQQISRQLIGDRVREQRGYSLTVRNSRRDTVQLELSDYIPVSQREDISVELLDGGGSTLSKEKGLLTWRVNLKPGESRELRFMYEVRYPRSRYSIRLD